MTRLAPQRRTTRRLIATAVGLSLTPAVFVAANASANSDSSVAARPVAATQNRAADPTSNKLYGEWKKCLEGEARPTRAGRAMAGSKKATGFSRLVPPAQKPIVGSPFAMTAELSTPNMRVARLQRLQGGKWINVTTGLSRDAKKNPIPGVKGNLITFDKVVLTGVTPLRVLVPKMTSKTKLPGKNKPAYPYLPKPLPQIISKTCTVTPANKQDATIADMPAIAQNSPNPEAPLDGTLISVGIFPAREGRPVQLQQKSGDNWTTVQTGTEDRSGYTLFNVAPGGEYRAYADPFGDAPAYDTMSVIARNFQPDFTDTFDGDALDGRWNDQIRPAGAETGLRTCARQNASVRRVEGGVLKLGIGLDTTRASETCNYTTTQGAAGTSPYLWNTQVATENSYQFQYGFAAARMKLHAPKGAHSCFWMLPKGNMAPAGPRQYGKPETGIEVDIMEYFGGGATESDDRVATFLHNITAPNTYVKEGELFPQTAFMKPAGDRWASSYHVFSMEWTPYEYVFRIDGREFYRRNTWVSQVPQYLVLSNLTSDYELGDLNSNAANLGLTTDVDWVRTWKY